MFGSPPFHFQTALIASRMNARHALQGSVSQHSHPVEDLMMNALRRPGVHVHWGVYMSGKSKAAFNACLKLQDTDNRLVILLHGFDFFSHDHDMRSRLRGHIGVPMDERDVSKYFRRPTSVIIDHAEWCMNSPLKLGSLMQGLRELGVGAMLIVSSWERAMELRDAGCELLGRADCGRWTQEHLEEMRVTLGKAPDEEAMRLSVLSGTPAYIALGHDNRSARRAFIQAAEWFKGTIALERGIVVGVGTFPDRNGTRHWRNPFSDTVEMAGGVELDCAG